MGGMDVCFLFDALGGGNIYFFRLFNAHLFILSFH